MLAASAGGRHRRGGRSDGGLEDAMSTSSPTRARGLLGNRRNQERKRLIGSALVLAQFALLALCLLPVGPVLWSGLRAAGLACLGLAAVVGVLALIAMGRDLRVHPVPGEQARLRTGGIYGLIRHPMYLAVLLAALGVVLSTGRLLAVLATLGLAAVLTAKAAFEDRLLQAKFGWQFAVYACRVPAILPQPWRSYRR
jgi:protein-S-isoprenylcysteine O-methyltransferase Ste14